MTFTNAVAAELRGEMARQGRTLPDVAAAAGIPYVTVQRYMSGARAFPMPAYYALTSELGVNPADLMAAAVERLGDDDPAPNADSHTA